jgi:NADH-quinone oxidoreductase subunit E
MLRRLHKDQPETFAFTPANQTWAAAQITKYPEGRQASAIIPLLWRAQEQESWLTRPAIEHIAAMLDMAYIRALEVASFYFMFQLQPVGSIAHIQVCGTLSCMICGAEDLVGICKEKIAAKPHDLSADGKFSWEEVECLGSCANAPMAQIGKDYYEDLTAERFTELLDELAAGQVPVPGPQNGRFAAEPLTGLTSLKDFASDKPQYNASVQLAVDLGDTVKRIDGTEVPILTPWLGQGEKKPAPKKSKSASVTPAAKAKADSTGVTKQAAQATSAAKPVGKSNPTTKSSATASKSASAETDTGTKPETLATARKSGADDLKLISGVGPKLEDMLNALGFWHFDQISKWTDAEIVWVDSQLTFKGRIVRDNWVDQATKLLKS